MRFEREHAEYRFIGTDGSLGYRKGQVYVLVVDRPGEKYPVQIVGGGVPCPYSSEAAFRENWEQATGTTPPEES